MATPVGHPFGCAGWELAPKVEYHVHLEGCADAALVLALHRRHGLEWGGDSEGQVAERLRFNDFHGFLGAFREVCRSVREEGDFADLVVKLFERLGRERVVLCEFFHSPAAAEKFGLRGESCVEAILEAARVEGARRGIAWGLVLDGVRHFQRESLRRTVDLAVRYHPFGVSGVGVGGDERDGPLDWAAPLFHRAREAGLRVSLHTGETGTPESMEADLRSVRPNRVGHGLHAADSPRIRDIIVEGGMEVDLCPVSNLRTGVVASPARHPLPRFLEAGVPFALATDDPGLFGTDLAAQYRLALEMAPDFVPTERGPEWDASARLFGDSIARGARPGWPAAGDLSHETPGAVGRSFIRG